jgi:hypothetical protein
MSRRFIAFAAAILIAAPVAVLSGESSAQQTTAPRELETQVKKIPAPYTRASSGNDIYCVLCFRSWKRWQGRRPSSTRPEISPYGFNSARGKQQREIP